MELSHRVHLRFAQHGARTGKQAGQPADEDDPALQRRSRHAGDQTQVGEQPIVGTEHPRADRVAGHRTVPALKHRP